MAKQFLRNIFISLFVALCFAMFSFPAFADMDPVKFSQWINIGMTASNIVAESTLPYVAPVIDFLGDPFNITEGVYTVINYAYPRANLETPSMTLESYLKRSSVQIRGDTVTIDGIDYQDVWLTHDAAQAFRTNVFDLETAFNIASNSNGLLVSGVGTLQGMPYYDVGGRLRTSSYSASFPLDESYYNYYALSGSAFLSTGIDLQYPYNKGLWRISSVPNQTPSTVTGSNVQPGESFSFYFFYDSGYWKNSRSLTKVPSTFTSSSQPFDFTWVSQTIPAEQLDSDDGIHIYVPNNPQQFSDPEVQQKINTFNLNVQNNFEFNTPIDLSTENNYTLFDHLVDVAVDLDIKPQYGPYNVYPPSPTPVPTEPVPWPTLEPTPEPTAEPTPEPTSEPTPAPSSEPTPVPSAWPSPAPTSPIGDTPFNLLDDGLGRLFDALKNGFNNLVDSFEFGEANFFGSILESLFEAFLAFFDRLKSVLGIWRYVVAWVGNISAPLNWTLSVLGNSGSYFLSPFAAIAAASVVIAIYRRFFK